MPNGAMPLDGRTPVGAEFDLLRALCIDCRFFLDPVEFQMLMSICDSQDLSRLSWIETYWGADCMNPVKGIRCESFAVRYQISSFLKKLAPSVKKDRALSLEAEATFDAAEQTCRLFNESSFRALAFSDDVVVNKYLGRMQRFIISVIGQMPDHDSIITNARHGSGATSDHRSVKGHRYYKYSSIPYSVTPRALKYAKELVETDERWMRALAHHFPGTGPKDWFQTTSRNRIDFVPKSRTTDRTIACEPTLNVMLQLGVDRIIRTRLKKFGIDLDNQAINQRLSKQGSIDGTLCTVDLSAASDSVSLRLCKILLPPQWFSLLYDLRSDIGVFPCGREVSFEKISSMGNGYTFALESLLFAAAVYAVDENPDFGNVSAVYGDDIVCRTEFYPELVRLLSLMNFSVNTKKSFSSGPFRESCGADYFLGQNVRPTFVRAPLNELDAHSVYAIINGMQRWCFTWLNLTWGESLCVNKLLKWLPPYLHLYGPYDDNDLSSYIAHPIPGRLDKNGTYRFKRLAVSATCFPEELEYFRLLSHELTPLHLHKWSSFLEKHAPSDRFAVTRRNHFRYRRVSGFSFAWDTYYEPLD